MEGEAPSLCAAFIALCRNLNGDGWADRFVDIVAKRLLVMLFGFFRRGGGGGGGKVDASTLLEEAASA